MLVASIEWDWKCFAFDVMPYRSSPSSVILDATSFPGGAPPFCCGAADVGALAVAGFAGALVSVCPETTPVKRPIAANMRTKLTFFMQFSQAPKSYRI